MENVSTAETTVGIDLGDRQSRVCILSAEGEVREEGWIATTEAALVPRFRAMARARIVMEVGTHSPWVSRLLQAAGHEVHVDRAGRPAAHIHSGHPVATGPGAR